MKIRLHKVSLFLVLISSTAFGFSKETIDIKSEFTDETFKVSVLPQSESIELFNKLANSSMIPFDLISDGCYARAYLMITYAQLKNVFMAKRVVEVINKTEATIVIPSKDKTWLLRWYYHVAPMLYVRDDSSNEIKEMILDPSLFSRPVTVEEFIEAMSFNTKVKLDSFLLPAYVSEKNELSKNVNMRRLDNFMLVRLSQANDFAMAHGQYLEKTALFDDIQKKCFKGGFEVPLSECI